MSDGKISVSALYEHITKSMTAEEALKILLRSSLLTYDKLKFDEGDQPVHPLFIIAMAAMDLGWIIAVEREVDEIRGLSVGTEDYMEKYNFLSKHYEEGEDKVF